jgi:predicted ester cyclase
MPKRGVAVRQKDAQRISRSGVKVEDILAEGNRVAVRASWTGTHRGAFHLLSLALTNRSFVMTGIVFRRIDNGRIAERWATLDRMGLTQQLTAKS